MASNLRAIPGPPRASINSPLEVKGVPINHPLWVLVCIYAYDVLSVLFSLVKSLAGHVLSVLDVLSSMF